MSNSNKCNICCERLLSYKNYTKCTLCHEQSHPKCNFLSKTDAELLLQSKTWTCYNCSKDMFPLVNENINSINDIDLFIVKDDKLKGLSPNYFLVKQN